MPNPSQPEPGPCQVGDVSGKVALERALDGLEDETPDRIARAIRWLRDPAKHGIRLVAGVVLVVGGLLWFLPVLGIEMLPAGLLLLAMDVPPLRRPVARATLWLECRWTRLRRRWRRRPRPLL